MGERTWQGALAELLSALAEVAREAAGYVRQEREAEAETRRTRAEAAARRDRF